MRCLGASGCAEIDRAAREILGTIGLAEAPESVIAAVTTAGGQLTGAGRLTFSDQMIDAALLAHRGPVVLCGQDAAYDLTLAPGRSYVGTGGAAPQVVDFESRRFRPSTLADLADAARLSDRLDHIQFFSRSLVAGDLADARAVDVNTAFACLAGTTKHVMVSASDPAHIGPIAEICYAIAGGEAAFRARPFLSLNINHVVPPLRFHAESCGVMEAAVHAGIPVQCNVFGQLGASSPVTLAGAVAQTMAEALAGIVLAWLFAPGSIAICGPRPMITDLRTGGMSGGSGEQALATAMAAEMSGYYGLANSVIAGATDSKLPDAQAGFEKALNVTLAVQAGANLVTQAAGMQAGLMAASFEAYVIDNDMLGTILRATAPLELSAQTLAVETIREAVMGEGHFLGQAETYARMKSDFLYPDLADRQGIDAWLEAGAPDLRDRARDRAREILATHRPRHLDPRLIADLTARFDLDPMFLDS